jgi:hypothetical protein
VVTDYFVEEEFSEKFITIYFLANTSTLKVAKAVF